jgi:hypothetical protein
MIKTQTLINNLFNKNVKEVKNENEFIPNHGVNDADRVTHFDNYNRDLVFKIKQIKAQ